ncbi:hypothetical protein GCM10027160_54490 [Streptomyces calidiresistens]
MRGVARRGPAGVPVSRPLSRPRAGDRAGDRARGLPGPVFPVPEELPGRRDDIGAPFPGRGPRGDSGWPVGAAPPAPGPSPGGANGGLPASDTVFGGPRPPPGTRFILPGEDKENVLRDSLPRRVSREPQPPCGDAKLPRSLSGAKQN